jgi:glycerophosphoryl diester phosphodiesterase
MLKKLSIASMVLTCTIACTKPDAPRPRVKAEPLAVQPGRLIAKALGEIDGVRDANSIEALRCNYRRGFRWFEVDLATTADGELVCFRKGDEGRAGLPQRVGALPAAQVEAARYAGRFPIVTVSALLAESERLGSDVVLILDAAAWSPKMEEAVTRTLSDRSTSSTQVVLQVYAEEDLPRIEKLSKRLGSNVLWNLRNSDLPDVKVEEVARQHSLLGVAMPVQRFTPWLAERLHAGERSVLVQTVNDHKDIVSLLRAGANGFFTDHYVPLNVIAADPTTAMNCGESTPSPKQLEPWTIRDLSHSADFSLRSCATRKSLGSVDLENCTDEPTLVGRPLGIPAGQSLHIEIEAEVKNKAPVAHLWLELAKKHGELVRPRDVIEVHAGERRSWQSDIVLERGSIGITARLGLGSKREQLSIRQLRLSVGSARSAGGPDGEQSESDASD